MKTYVLDTYALMAYFLNQAGGIEVKSILREGVSQKALLAMSIINLGELYFMVHKKDSPTRASQIWKHIGRYSIQTYPATTERTFTAAQLKAIYSTSKNQLSYADCFAAGLAQELNGILVTGDPEFIPLQSALQIQFLPR